VLLYSAPQEPEPVRTGSSGLFAEKEKTCAVVVESCLVCLAQVPYYKLVENPGIKLNTMPATVEELQGLIAGLSEVVKRVATNLNTVATQVGAITAASHGQQSSEANPVVTQNSNLRLPTL